MTSTRRSWPRVALIALGCLIIGVYLGGHTSWMPSWIRSTFSGQSSAERQFDDILGLIQKNYYRPLSANTLVNNGLEAAVQSLDDPYSHYFPPTQEQAFQTETNPQVSGIGVEVSPEKAGLLVLDVFPGGPAAKAKIQVGSVITAVDHRSLRGVSETTATDLVKGRAGTRVTLGVTTGSHTVTVTVVREQVTQPVVSGQIRDYHGLKLGYVDFAQFTQGSSDQLRTEVKQLLHQGAQGFILDLRDNPGGLVNDAVGVASIFIPDGTIVTTRGRNQPTNVYTALGDAIVPKLPLIVLADRGTASSAEIVTAALQQRGRAKVVGTRTYGKGVFQESQTVPGGGILDITVGEFFTPDGKNLGGSGVAQGKDLVRGPGIKPNYYVYDNPDAPGLAALYKGEAVLASEIRSGR